MSKKRNRASIALLAVATAVTAVLSGCSGSVVASSAGGSQAPQGVTANQVKVAAVLPMSGASGNYGPIWSSVIQAYFDYTNDHGGVNGRKLKLVVKDSAYDPAQGLAVAKQAVTNDKVFSVLATAGSSVNATVLPYLNQQHVLAAWSLNGVNANDDPAKDPYTFQWDIPYDSEAKIYWNYLQDTYPGKKIGVLYQNDAFGLALYDPFKKLAGDSIVADAGYGPSDSSVNSQIQSLKAKGAEVVVEWVVAKYAALAAKARSDAGWDVPVVVASNANDPSVLTSATPQSLDGLEGGAKFPLLSDASNPQVQLFDKVVAKYAPDLDKGPVAEQGFGAAEMYVEQLKRAGKNPTQQSMIKAGESFSDYKDVLLIGAADVTSKVHNGIHCEQFTKFDGALHQSYVSDKNYCDN
jgi:branched-chain amino acid transport system substrate-binding protein